MERIDNHMTDGRAEAWLHDDGWWAVRYKNDWGEWISCGDKLDEDDATELLARYRSGRDAFADDILDDLIDA